MGLTGYNLVVFYLGGRGIAADQRRRSRGPLLVPSRTRLPLGRSRCLRRFLKLLGLKFNALKLITYLVLKLDQFFFSKERL